jgi:hypothetical protein
MKHIYIVSTPDGDEDTAFATKRGAIACAKAFGCPGTTVEKITLLPLSKAELTIRLYNRERFCAKREAVARF